LLLASYLWGRQSAGDQVFVEETIEDWTYNNPTLARVVIATTAELRPTHRAVERVVSVVERVPSLRSDLIPLIWSRWPERLSLEDFQILISTLGMDTDQTLHAALFAVDRRVESIQDTRAVLSPMVWKLLENPLSATSNMLMHFWDTLGKRFATLEPVRAARSIVNVFNSSGVILDENDGPMKALVAAIDADKEGVWTILADELLKMDSSGYRLLSALRGWFVHRLPSEFLLEWAKKHQPNGSKVLARLVEPSEIPLNELARMTLDEFSEVRTIDEILYGNFHSGAFQGRMTTWLDTKLSLARAWTKDPSPRVRAWARKLVDSLETEISEWKTREAEDYP